METHTLEVTAAIKNMETVMAFIDEHTASIGNPKITHNLAIIAEELSMNVFSYAYDGHEGFFSLNIKNDADRRMVTMAFRDSGKPFNPLMADEPDINAPLKERSIGGLGILIAKKLTDEQHYVRENGQNILTIIKKY